MGPQGRRLKNDLVSHITCPYLFLQPLYLAAMPSGAKRLRGLRGLGLTAGLQSRHPYCTCHLNTIPIKPFVGSMLGCGACDDDFKCCTGGLG